MSKDAKGSSTFSAGRRWSARFAVLVSSLSVLAVVAMLNYASQRYFSTRLFLSSHTEVELSGQTLGLLRSLTNDVEVILYYDREEALYPLISSLLNEYRLACPRIQVRTVDYIRDPAEAAEVKIKYGLSSVQEKNLVVFDSGGRKRIVPGTMLAQYELEQVPDAEELEFRKKPVFFNGEKIFSSVILAISSPKPLKAYYLTGHREHDPTGGDPQMGYMTFTSLLNQNYINAEPLSLLGTNMVPEDCNLLIIAGPAQPLASQEVKRVETYLNQGGRLLVMLSYESVGRRLGLEEVLKEWGVRLGPGVVREPKNTISGADVISEDFGLHPIMNPLLGSRVHMILPRPVGLVGTNETAAGTSEVDAEVLAWSSPMSLLMQAPAEPPARRPLGVAVGQTEAPGVVTERGVTRMVVLGDSILFGNEMIESAGNREFADAIINWLLDRTALLEGVGPKPVQEYRLVMTDLQFTRIQWILLGGLPMGVLAIGGVVWLSRRR